MTLEPLLPAGTVVHLAGRLTDTVFSFLGPATEALAAAGAQQRVVLFDDPRSEHLLPRFHDSVKLVLAEPGAGPSAGPILRALGAPLGPFGRWAGALRAYRHALAAPDVTAVHFHGYLPCMLGALAAHAQPDFAAPLYYSPHGSRTLGALKPVGSALSAMLSRRHAPAWQHGIANVGADAKALASLAQRPVNLVESPVAQAYFDAARNEAREPLVLASSSGGRGDVRCAETLGQLAVLLGGSELKVNFNWIGAVTGAVAAPLKAAHIPAAAAAADSEHAARLGRGWLFVAAGGALGFPHHLATAMACGLPCVAEDTPYHRDLLRHGKTGYLYVNERDLLLHVAQLIDSPTLRQRIGQAARAEAQRRFSELRFRDALFSAYLQPVRRPRNPRHALAKRQA